MQGDVARIMKINVRPLTLRIPVSNNIVQQYNKRGATRYLDMPAGQYTDPLAVEAPQY